jgi:hypothetical protein
MSKILKLKQWVTVADAAEHLTLAAGETVSEADLLQLALDSQLLISVYIVSEAIVQPCIVRRVKSKTESATARAEIEHVKNGAELLGAPLVQHQIPADQLRVWYPLGKTHIVISARNIQNPVTITGVWDLAMVGGDFDYVKNQLMDLLSKQQIKPSLDDLVFIKKQEEDEYFSLLKCEVKEGGGIYYVPAFLMPEDAFLVVRTATLLDFQQRLLADDRQCRKPLIDECEPKNSHLLVIAALLDLQKDPVMQARPRRNQTAIRESIQERNVDMRGLGKRTIEDIFGEANTAMCEAKKAK